MSKLRSRIAGLDQAAAALRDAGEAAPRRRAPRQSWTWRIDPYEKGMPKLGRFHLARYGAYRAAIRERPKTRAAYWTVNVANEVTGRLRTVAHHTASSVASAKREVGYVFLGDDYPAAWRSDEAFS